MQILRRRGWELPEREATPETVFRDRRRLIQAAALGSIAAAAGPLAARAAMQEDPTADLYPGQRNPAYTLDRPLTPEEVATTYNNFYEFGSSKGIWKRARDNLRIRPWTVHIDGDVEKPIEIGFDDLVRRMGVEERLYRHRCVEAWAMAVPWSGFPMAKLVEFARPLAKAKYVRMETFNDPDMASGQKEFWYPWPYVEGVTMEEGHQRARLHRHGPLRQACAGPERRAAAHRAPVEIRLQVDQVDCPLHLHREAAEELLGEGAGP